MSPFRFLSGARPLICGHRGNSVAAPENTIASLDAARRAGADFCEIDLRRTADGVFVLMHDRTVDRTTDGHGLVSQMTAADVAALDAGAWHSEPFRGERVPTFSATLAFAKAEGLCLIVEIKDQSADDTWLQDMGAEIAAAEMGGQCLISSFDHTQLQRLKQLCPGLATLGIAHVRVADAAALFEAAGLDALVLEFIWHDLADVAALTARGLAVTLSVPRPSQFETLERYGADDLSRLDAMLAAEAPIAMLIGDDVGWLRDRSDRATAVVA